MRTAKTAAMSTGVVQLLGCTWQEFDWSRFILPGNKEIDWTNIISTHRFWALPNHATGYWKLNEVNHGTWSWFEPCDWHLVHFDVERWILAAIWHVAAFSRLHKDPVSLGTLDQNCIYIYIIYDCTRMGYLQVCVAKYTDCCVQHLAAPWKHCQRYNSAIGSSRPHKCHEVILQR